MKDETATPPHDCIKCLCMRATLRMIIKQPVVNVRSVLMGMTLILGGDTEGPIVMLHGMKMIGWIEGEFTHDVHASTFSKGPNFPENYQSLHVTDLAEALKQYAATLPDDNETQGDPNTLPS